YLGRLDQQVKIRGNRIELGEIESALLKHGEVRQCAVCLKEDERGERRLVAYVVAWGDVAPTRLELRKYLQGGLPDYMVPSTFVALAELPLTTSGKLDRKALPAPAVEAATGEIEPRTATEEMGAGLWAEILKVKDVGMDQNFFELGGHSLLATQVISRLRDVLDVDLPLQTLFGNPTVSGLAQAVAREREAGNGADVPPLKPVGRDRQLPLSFAQQRLWFIHQLEPESTAYNVPMRVRLRGRLAVWALKQSQEEIARRHEVLRTRFVSYGGQPLQVIDEAGEMEI